MKYTVLIIDDEEPLREAIRLLGDWEGLGVGQLLEAADGLSGLRMLAEQRVDLAIVDMKMPGLNGAELLQTAQQQYPGLLTIVVSGYNDFEYTRQAIRSKVVDYLLKPVNRTELNQALRKAMDVLEAKRRQESDFIAQNITLNLSLPGLKEKMYLSILERSFKQQANEAFLPLIGADDKANRFVVVLLRILNLDQIRRSRFHGDTELLHFAVSNVVNEVAGAHFQAFSFANPKQERELVAILTMNGGGAADAAYRALHQVNAIAATLQRLFGIRVAAGIGGPVAEALDMAASFEEARSALGEMDLLRMNGAAAVRAAAADHRGSSSRSEVGVSGERSSSKAAARSHTGEGEGRTPGAAASAEKRQPKEGLSLPGRMAVIRQALAGDNLQQASSIISELARSWQDADRLSLGEADRIIREGIVLFGDLSLALGVPQERLPAGSEESLRSRGLSLDFATFEQFAALLQRLLSFYHEQLRAAQAVQKPFDIADIKAHIDRYYFEDIKISLYTDKYFLSREYLMKLFKQQFGCGIHEYVQKVRMDKARELLDDSALKIQDISELLGYKDKNYFSKAFRNYYSLSPTEYRSSKGNS
ncbi:two-component system, response regulator YesN [Paenibacillus algorifonticola]|uniref:Two-component system, response regulator YesN n=1 Tax=Paenibacillus algorifonticola TaxID=684063 RepID=A0A1I2IL74_9BACL|nr:response regulator [Paenibacillus algorifonticola]SFF41606.1 two-component system, response regulator YesN [Paenibacillus algorifonticola]